MGTLSVRDQNTLDQIARMAWGSSEGAKGGRGNIGIIKDEYGRSRIIKTDTHLFGSKTGDSDRANLVTASNALRDMLIKIAENSKLEPEKLNEIRGLLGIPEGDATANVPLLRRTVAQVVVKIDSKIWERATKDVNMRDFSSAHCNTDYKSVSDTVSSEGKASRVIQKPWDPVWRKLSTVGQHALAKAVHHKFGELLNDHFGSRIRNFYRDHQKTSIVDGKIVGREAEYAELKKTIENFDEIAVAKYHCCSDYKEKIQKNQKEQELFRSLVDKLSEADMAKLDEGAEKDRDDIAIRHVRQHLEAFGIKQEEGNVKETEAAIKKKADKFAKFMGTCVEYARKENGTVQRINKDMLSQAALKRVVKVMLDDLMISIVKAVDDGVIKHSGNKDGKTDEYTAYRKAYADEHRSDVKHNMEFLPRSFSVEMRVPSNRTDMLDPAQRDVTIEELGLKSGLSPYFCMVSGDDYTCKVSTEGVVRETKWALDNLFELAHPDATDEEHLQFVARTVDELLALSSNGNDTEG